MSEDSMNVRGRHADTAELQPVDATAVVPYAEDVDLADDPFADDLSEQLAARAPRRYYTKATVILAGLVLLAGGFFAGAQVEKNYGTPVGGSSGGTANGSNLAGAGGAGGFGNVGGGGFAGRGGTGQNSGGAGQNGGATGGGATAGGAAANTTTGTVKLVDGTTVYIQTPDGNVVTVKTNGSTSVQVAQNGALSDLTPGAQVTVEGATGSDGTVTATKVTKAK
jgi:hypothetical protein